MRLLFAICFSALWSGGQALGDEPTLESVHERRAAPTERPQWLPSPKPAAIAEQAPIEKGRGLLKAGVTLLYCAGAQLPVIVGGVVAIATDHSDAPIQAFGGIIASAAGTALAYILGIVGVTLYTIGAQQRSEGRVVRVAHPQPEPVEKPQRRPSPEIPGPW